jgi:hypothetical protein
MEAPMFSSRPFTFVLALSIALLLVSPGTGRAHTSWGLHGGFSSNPDQFIVGPHLNLDAVGEELYIVPSGEVGFGDHATTLAFNGDLQYRFVVHRSKVHPYAGGGLSLYYVNINGGGGSDTNLGVDILGGIFFGEMNGRPMFVDAKFGLTDRVPDWKFQFGFNF